MPYSLFRMSDGAGDSGPMSVRLWADKREDKNPRPIVGASISVGSLYARTYQMQDYWTTTPVTEILEDAEEKVVFKTRSGSLYTWKKF